MSKVIDFMEALGADASSLGLDADAYAGKVASLDLDPALAQALLARDQDRINALVGGRRNVLSLLVLTEDESDEQSGGDGLDGGHDTDFAPEAKRLAIG